MSNQLPIFETVPEASAYIDTLSPGGGDTSAAILRLGGGLLRFVNIAFPEADPSDVYAQINEREPMGRGPHFDVYMGFIRREYPYLGVYNLSGAGTTLTVAELPDEVMAAYLRLYPEPTDQAYAARREFAAAVLGSDTVISSKAPLSVNDGLILPQREQGPQVIHDIKPNSPAWPGSFLKLIVPDQKNEATMLRMRQGSYVPLDTLVTSALVAHDPMMVARAGIYTPQSATSDEGAGVGADFDMGWDRKDDPEPSDEWEPWERGQRQEPVRRSCNLD